MHEICEYTPILKKNKNKLAFYFCVYKILYIFVYN